ncbi:AAA family ATPase [Streptomyces roseirectus]|uniref:AAA family ATPase n=1 Tax=Streptomyces roseirectus TaxID=2768066 RepID=A0A7H0IEU7_9ACTN|nr:AAA family ATPase [Streptomyces roseirectus]QNP71313.1 AAA family ATPase [Streptomyces roseirectus]
MTKILITGMSGTGKSTAVEWLRHRGHRAIDTDTDVWSRWVTLPDGTRDWVWREQALTDLLAGHETGQGTGHLFVAGCKSNQGRFYAQFDHVALLSAPAEVLLARIAARTNNPYGKQAGEQAEILGYLREVEPLLRESATVEIDATAPVEVVARRLEALTDPPACSGRRCR